MPIYVYKCDKCDREIEALRFLSDRNDLFPCDDCIPNRHPTVAVGTMIRQVTSHAFTPLKWEVDRTF